MRKMWHNKFSAARDGTQCLQETSSEPGVHVTVYDRIVAGVRHGQCMKREEQIWHDSVAYVHSENLRKKEN